MDFSSGELRDYGKCPLMYKNKHVDERPADRDFKNAFVGGVLSRVVDGFYKQKMWKLGDDAADAMEELIPAAAAAVMAKDKILWLPEEEPLYLSRAAAMIPTILTTIKAEKLIGEITKTEHEMVIPLGEHVLHGRGDLIFQRQALLTVLDGKSGGTIGKYTDTDQLRFYAMAVKADPLFKRLPDRVGFWWYKHGKISWKKITPKSLAALWDKIVVTVDQIVKGNFAPTPGKVCKLCDYKVSCTEGQAFLLSNRKATNVPLDGCEGEVSL